ncbi:MAG TPA: hypothetical protein DEG71_02440 [Clostridiales bacterium]|nr:hypothetical protein [Clostridiales bacterium]
MYNYKKGVSYQFDVKGLGEFKFIFSRNSDITPGKDKYYFESYWNPENYGLVDFIVVYYVDNIEDEVKRLIYDLDYFIDGARISCICRIEAGHDDEGVYEGILYDYFDEEYEPKED